MVPVALAYPPGSGQIVTADSRCQNAAVPQLIVIVLVFMAQGGPRDPPGNQTRAFSLRSGAGNR